MTVRPQMGWAFSWKAFKPASSSANLRSRMASWPPWVSHPVSSTKPMRGPLAAAMNLAAAAIACGRRRPFLARPAALAPTVRSISANAGARVGSAAYSSCNCCHRMGSISVPKGGDHVETSPSPRIASGITPDSANPFPPGMAATQRLSQPVLPPPPSEPFSTQSCASKCERCRYGGATATTGSSCLSAKRRAANPSLPCKEKSLVSRKGVGCPVALTKAPRKAA